MVAEPWIWPAGLGLLGAIFGSFIATLAIRWPDGRSVSRGRSACDGCGRALGPHELGPLVSYVLQRGRCRSCGEGIAPSHFVVELLGLGVGVAAGIAAPGLDGVAGAVFGWLLLTLAALDLAAFWLPNLVTGALAVTGLLGAAAGLGPPLSDRLIGGAAGFAVLWLVAEGYRRARGRIGLGGGDPKLFGGIGLWLGWHALPGVLLIACLIGLAVVLVLRLRGKTLRGSDALPFGVLLAAAAFPAWVMQAVLA
ncbi:prepilin peptidase [Sphingomonas sp. IC-56]|uniref:prepilin peptidase n=1 Tax=Sphingomonas sp. IC-56 TaxID=2898529 RepID=UPI001E4DB571|nr:A24 family peptidase [Sphingomonas sp. IC-56]MCD2325412.1 prepilin peptidase [Sphingomonas sp. IC-56]